jgi:subtilase family serine protease
MRFQNQNRNVLKPRVLIGPGLIAGLLLAFAQVMAWSQQPQVSSINNFPSSVNTPKQVTSGAAKAIKAYEPTNKLRLAISIKAPHMAAEEKFLKELQDKNSPNFKKYLTPEQWNARFAPAAQDEQAVADWATSRGLTITARYPNRLMVNVEGTVDTIEKAFNIDINTYEVNGAIEFSNDRDPAIPSNLVGIVEYVDGLNSILRMLPANTQFKGMRGPDYTPGPVRQIGSAFHGGATAPAPKGLAKSNKPEGLGGQITNGWYDPTDIYSSDMYDYNALHAQGHCCNPNSVSGHDGGGPVETSIGLATDGDFADSDWDGFHAQYPYLAYFYYHVFVNGTPGCCSDESTLDLEWSIATSNSFTSNPAYTAQVYNYEAAQGFGDFGTVFQQMVNDNLVRVVNISYGLNESYLNGFGLVSSWHGIFNQMLGQGMTINAASGDNGASTGCGDAIATIYPGSDPDVVSVGGTQLALNGDGSFSSEVTWTGDNYSGACSSNHGGTGGGCSTLFQAPGYQQSPYQSGPVCGTGSRSLPDVALNASSHTAQNYYFGGTLQGVGGTSIATPEVSGFMAQENAYLLALGLGGAPLGDPHYKLYWLGEHTDGTYEQHYPYYDVTSGCNSNDITNLYGLGSWCAETGYDRTTGWGTFNALQLAWAFNTYDFGDGGGPAITFSGPFSGNGSDHWYNTDQTVSWTVADTGTTGVAGFSQAWDSAITDSSSEATPGSGDSFYSGPQFPNATSGYLDLASAGQGCHYATVYAWNNTGFTSGNQYYYYICYDTIAPTVSASNSPAANSYGYNNSTVDVTLKATDPGTSPSGIKTTYYGLNQLCNASNLGACKVYSGTIPVTAAGYNFVAYFTEDIAGNVSGVSYDNIYVDEVAPVTTATLSGTLHGSTYDTAVKVTLSATDNYSGVASTHYSVDGGATDTYSAPFTVTALGSHTVKFYSVDRAGNTEATKSVTFSIASSTSTVLTASPNPSVIGKTVTLAAKVTASLSGTPSGTVTFKNGATTLGTETLSGGEATLTTTALPAGTDVLTAVYNGATTFFGSTSASVSEDVEQTTTTTLASSVNPSDFGKSITFTATVKPSGSGSPNGSVKFLDGTTVLATETLPTTGGKVSFSTAALIAGTHSITAVYEGSSVYNGSSSAALSEVVEKSAVTVSITTSLNPSVYGQSVTFTASVTSTYTVPTGTVTFESNGTSIGTGTISAGKATLSTETLPVGTHSITAVYPGSENFYSKTSTAISEVTKAASTATKLYVGPSPGIYGQLVTLTAAVSPEFSGTAGGTVTFKDGTTTLGTATLSGGEAKLHVYDLGVGSHSLTVVYGGSADFTGSTSTVVKETVNPASTATTVSSSLNPSTSGASVTFTAKVTPASGPAATGTVAFKNGSTTLGTGALNSSGEATYATKTLAVGTHSITAVFEGSASDLTSTSAALSQVVK